MEPLGKQDGVWVEVCYGFGPGCKPLSGLSGDPHGGRGAQISKGPSKVAFRLIKEVFKHHVFAQRFELRSSSSPRPKHALSKGPEDVPVPDDDSGDLDRFSGSRRKLRNSGFWGSRFRV